MPRFNFNSSIKDIQNNLVAQSIRNKSNAEILRSEDAIKNLIKSYSDRFQAIDGMLFNVSRYVTESKTVIRSDDFDDMFESIWMDLRALYGDMDLVEQVLSLNLYRNKSYFLIIKKRIKDLWNRLNVTRLSIYDSNPTDESFYESFQTDINAAKTQNVVIDKKAGYLHLTPVYKRKQNKPHQVKNVTSTTYPVANDQGGVRFTTDELNTFEENYERGPRDMLQNGLWKEEIICNDIPLMNIDIGDDNGHIYKEVRGIISTIDIEYSHSVDVNRLDIDLYGDYPTKVIAVMYKQKSDDAWTSLQYEVDHDLNGDQIGTESVSTQAFDLITLYNIAKKKVKYLRIVLNQEHYNFLDSRTPNEAQINQRIYDDLSQRRYELIKFGSSLDDRLNKPVNDDNVSLYSKIVEIIESTKNIEVILNEIDKMLRPETEIVDYNFSKTAKFEIGAWSIDPKIERYTRLVGIYDSNPYELRDRSLLSVALKTSQKTPLSTTCNWYINLKGKSVPVVPNQDLTVKEPIYPVSMAAYSNLANWGNGTFILLDFPVDSNYTDQISIYESPTDTSQSLSDFRIVFLNSRLLYLSEMVDPFRSNFVIKYHPASFNAVNLYTLQIRPGKDLAADLELGIVSSRKRLLTAFLGSASYNGERLSDIYSVVSAPSTTAESLTWFGSTYQKALFIADSIYDDSDFSYDSRYDPFIYHSTSKISFTQSDLNFYLNSTNDELELITNASNIAPLPLRRKV